MTSAPSKLPILVGTTFAGRYEILKLLASGETSSIFKARDLLVDQVVALKLIHANLARQKNLVERFKAEPVLVRKLAHANIIRIFDIGQGEGLLYISMEYIDGSDLATLIEKTGPMPLPRFMSIFSQLCSALAYLHSQRIVHRDIQPANLMLDCEGTLKLIDFGIARDYATESLGPSSGRITAYTAPEIVQGQATSPAADIFAAGLVLFELMTGRSSSARASADLPPRRSEFPEIPLQLVRLLQTSMEPNPKKRFKTMEALVAAAISLDVRVNTSVADPQRKSLSSLLQIDPPPPEAVILTCLEVLEAVETAHSKERSLDLFPQSIEFNRDGKFVIPSMPEPEWNRTLLITSPKYISPETFLEKTEEADQERQTSEIYVLGLIFYELLCGRRVFDLEFSEFQGQEQQYLWLSWHGDLNTKARPLSEVLPGFPKSFSGVVAQMMEKRAEHRFKRLQEVRDALSAVKQRLESEEERKSGSTVMMSRDGTKHARQLARKRSAIGLLVSFALISALFFLEERSFSEAI